MDKKIPTKYNPFKHYKDKDGKIIWPVFIPKKFVKKVKNAKGLQFYIVSYVENNQAKEVFIPFSFLREHESGKGYFGHIQIDLILNGRIKEPIKINTNEWLKYFPPVKMPKKRKSGNNEVF